MGDAAPRTLSELVHAVTSAWPHARVLALTSAGTGVPTLRGLDLAVLPTFCSLRYEVVPGLAPDGVGLPTEAVQLDRLAGQGGAYDVVLLDPFHTLDSSRRGLRAALTAAARSSIVLVHDCAPPVELRGEPYRPGSWCGVTDEAFLEACLEGDRDWLTVDSDFGVGILGPAGSRRVADDAESAAEALWRDATTAEGRSAVLDKVGPALLHLTPPDEATPWLDAMLDAALGARRVARATAYRSPVDELRAEVGRLSGQLAVAEERERATAVHHGHQVAAARAETDDVRAQLDLLRSSPSMRVGRALTAPVRAVRGLGRGPAS